MTIIHPNAAPAVAAGPDTLPDKAADAEAGSLERASGMGFTTREV